MLKNRDFTENRTEPVHLSASNYPRTGYLVSAFLNPNSGVGRSKTAQIAQASAAAGGDSPNFGEVGISHVKIRSSRGCALEARPMRERLTTPICALCFPKTPLPKI
jgi:hypothetical protein